MFRLHIDIPLSDDEAPSAEVAKQVIEALVLSLKTDALKNDLLKVVQYRLGKDEDRKNGNYFVKNENGHIGHKKTVIDL